ncbi:MAG TPA: acyltransferase [Polyangiaceae bacterium]|nr:acyltransferase [Polyangiaceae bacterium]
MERAAEGELPRLIDGRNVAPEDTRLIGIDTLRVLSAFAVVGIHTNPPLPTLLHCLGLGVLSTIGAQLYRFSVPFFFASGGYFLGRSQLKEESGYAVIEKRVKRLLWIFLFWSLVFVIIPLDWHKEVLRFGPLGMVEHSVSTYARAWVAAPFYETFGGSAYHLWFISALASAYVLVGLARRLGLASVILPLAVVLYVWGVFSSVYTPCWQALFGAPPPRVLGLHFALLPVVAGWKLGSGAWRVPSFRVALLITGLAAALSIVELWGVTHYFGTPRETSWVFSTWLFGLGALLIALARPRLGHGTRLPQLAKYTLGIYVLHPIFVNPVASIAARLPFGADLATPVVFTLTLLLTALLNRSRWLAPVLT